jgi:hypothetical protein
MVIIRLLIQLYRLEFGCDDAAQSEIISLSQSLSLFFL